jgi:hypothetical protein
MSAPVRHVLCAALLSSLFVTASAAQDAQLPVPAERKKALLEGTHVFRRILYDNDCTALKSFDELKDDPSKSILIVFGDLDRITDVPGGLANFVKAGGAVLLASDRPLSDGNASAQLLAIAGVRIGEETVFLNPHFRFRTPYKGLPYCPILEPVAGTSPALFSGDAKEGSPALSVATNVPTHLVHVRRLRGVNDLARLPAGCQYDPTAKELQQGFWGRPLTDPTFLVGGDVGDGGRVLVAADHSVFINEMMLPDDTNNVEFSINCIRYLRDGEQRSRVLLIDEGGIQTKFDVPLKSAQIPFDEMVDLLFEKRNHIIKAGADGLVRLERNNAFNNAAGRLLARLDNPPGRLFAIVATLATIALLIFGMIRLGILGRFSHDSRVAPLALAVGRTQPAAPLVQQRNYALLRLGRMNEPAGQLARRWLLSQGIAPPDESSSGEIPATVKGGWWAGRGLRRKLNRVWLLAAGRSRETTSPAQLWQLQRELEALAASRQRGEWQPSEG